MAMIGTTTSTMRCSKPWCKAHSAARWNSTTLETMREVREFINPRLSHRARAAELGLATALPLYAMRRPKTPNISKMAKTKPDTTPL
jgi:hypothetical protein